jgi:hypothetical protein
MFLYLIRQVGSNLYKIGISKQPEVRMHSFQEGNPRPLELIIKLEVGHVASKIEHSIHTAFATKRIRGEWFTLTNEDQLGFADLVARLCPQNICYKHRTINCRWCAATGGDGYYVESTLRAPTM